VRTSIGGRKYAAIRCVMAVSLMPAVVINGLDYKRSDIHEVVAEIERQRDRGAAPVAAALLEEHLLLAIRSALTRHESVEQKMFKGDGPLANFSAKIDLGLLLGLYPMSVHKHFHQIRKIRNEFAHNMKPITFRSQRVKVFAPL
jgi:hypothetical protein